MNTDRELLELAAKAAGLSIVQWRDDVPYIYFDKLRWWDPLNSKAQARNLRHRLQLTTGLDDLFNDFEPSMYAIHPDGCVRESIAANTSKGAAQRRAIVRAAAEIGREMP